MNKDGSETIKVSSETKTRLTQLGRKGETFDEVIRRLLPLKSKQKKEVAV